jgi:hypothetical protein
MVFTIIEPSQWQKRQIRTRLVATPQTGADAMKSTPAHEPCVGIFWLLRDKLNRHAQPALGCKRLAPNIHVSPREKLTSEQHKIAIPLAANTGSSAPATSTFIRARFPTSDTIPFDKWNRAHCPSSVAVSRRSRQV